MITMKKTKKDYFNEILAQYELTSEHKTFIDNEITLLNNRKSANRKPTASQELAEKLIEQVVEVFDRNEGKRFTATELVKELQPLYEDITLTNQRLTAVLNKMMDRGKAAKVKDGRKTLFYAITE